MFFWLCENCCSTMVLNFDQHKRLAVVPLSSGKRDGRVSGLTGAKEFGARPLLSRRQAGQLAEHATRLK